MTTSPQTSLKSLISREDTQLAPAQLGYMSGRAKSKAHATVLALFNDLAREDNLTRAFLARRLGKKPEQITRWLGAPGNWTLDTLSNLLAAMGYEPTFGVQPLDQMRQSNEHHPLAVIQNQFFTQINPIQTSSVKINISGQRDSLSTAHQSNGPVGMKARIHE